jgi:Ca2+-transporting ATPase
VDPGSVTSVAHGVRLTQRPDALDPRELAAVLASDLSRGLGASEAHARAQRWGPNELAPHRSEPAVRRFVRGLIEPMSLLLIAASAVSGLALGESADAFAILAIVFLNATIAFVQEGRASRALEALRAMESPEATVVRDGREAELHARDVVLGDVMILRPGRRVAADARLFEAGGLEADESLLTGESVPVSKSATAAASDAVSDAGSISDRRSMVFDGTLITRGTGRAIVVATGMGSELGAIAGRLEQRSGTTPLQRQLRTLAIRIGSATVVVALLVVLLMVLRPSGEGLLERAFLVGVALAVAAVPEGLAAVTTVTLALGVKRMADRGGIVRRLPAVETLGSTTVLAIDKTGTLTENRMRVARLEPGPGRAFDEVAALCSDAIAEPRSGDPLEIALIEASGTDVGTLRAAAPRVASIPFDADRRRMTTVHRRDGGFVVAIKGAPESVVPLCSSVLAGDGSGGPIDRTKVSALADEMATSGLRVVALARREIATFDGDVEAAEGDLTLVALAGLQDPVRPAAEETVRAALGAGMRIVMVTGDHPATAESVAYAVGLAAPPAQVRTGADLRRDGVPVDPLSVPVYARVDPDQKLAIVERLQELGHVVAVTGDGVNDAPALRRADIGVALGRSGTDVAREAADLVITDDDLATIVAAVREGRGIYANVRKVVDYLLACNFSEVLAVLGTLVAFPEIAVPLLPLQLLWMNLVTDGLPALALGVDPTDDAVMDEPPRPASQRLLDGSTALRLAGRGIVMAISAIAALTSVRYGLDRSWHEARAAMFTVLVFTQLMHAFSARQVGSSVRERIPPIALLRSIAANRRLAAAVAGGALLQVAIIVLPGARTIFGTTGFDLAVWGVVIALAAVGAFFVAALPTINPSARPPALRRERDPAHPPSRS